MTIDDIFLLIRFWSPLLMSQGYMLKLLLQPEIDTALGVLMFDFLLLVSAERRVV